WAEMFPDKPIASKNKMICCIICRCIREATKGRPLKRSFMQWEPSDIHMHMWRWPAPLNPYHLAMRAIILIALSTIWRLISEVGLLLCQNVIKVPNANAYTIRTPMPKNRKSCETIIWQNKEQPLDCPVNALTEYIKWRRTQHAMIPMEGLFLNPYMPLGREPEMLPVTTVQVRKWVNTIYDECGIIDTLHKIHGMSTAEICRMGGWSEGSRTVEIYLQNGRLRQL
ncbi:hypothetical protein H4S06_002652, partial [Coemansia sp. BCRC 34490]